MAYSDFDLDPTTPNTCIKRDRAFFHIQQQDIEIYDPRSITFLDILQKYKNRQ